MKRVAAMLASTLLAAGIFLSGPWLLGIDRPAFDRRLWQLQRRIFGAEPVGIF